MSQIPVQKTVFNKVNFPKVVDTQFHQLFNSQQGDDTPEFTLEDFADL